MERRPSPNSSAHLFNSNIPILILERTPSSSASLMVLLAERMRFRSRWGRDAAFISNLRVRLVTAFRAGVLQTAVEIIDPVPTRLLILEGALAIPNSPSSVHGKLSLE